MQPLEIWELNGRRYVLRRAAEDDIAAIVGLLTADPLGANRGEGAELAPYQHAFAAIDNNPTQLLLVAGIDAGIDAGTGSGTGDETVVGTLQLTFIPGMARLGALRAQIETLHIAAEHRDRGLGRAMITWSVGEAQRRGSGLIQLTSDKTRIEAHKFYARLGFTASHEGLKLRL